MTPRPSRQKIQMPIFLDLFYKQRLPTKQIAAVFGIAISSIGSFRQRHHLPGRGWSVHPMLGKKHRQDSLKKLSQSLKGRIPWNKRLPSLWNCVQCSKTFPNLTGHQRRFCSYRCYWLFASGHPNKGVFQSGKSHWNYRHDRTRLIKRCLGQNVFTYPERIQLLKRANYQCQKCQYTFPRLPAYRLRAQVRFDHIKPIALGGQHSMDNGQILCKICERDKTRADHRAIHKAQRIIHTATNSLNPTLG